MPTPQNIATKLRDADARFLKSFIEEDKTDIFAGATLKMNKPEGYVIFPVMTRNPTFKKLLDEHAPEGLDAKNVTISTDEYVNAVEIPRKALENSKATIGQEFMAPIMGMAADAIGLRMQMLTTLVEANGNDILEAAFFGTAQAIFNSDHTVTNLVTATGQDAASIKTDYDSFRSVMMTQRNSGGRLYHGASGRTKPIIIMHPEELTSVMEDVFQVKTLAAGGANKYASMNVDLRCNPLLSSATGWYPIIKGASYPPLVVVDEGNPTTANNAGSGDSVERDVQLRSVYTYSANYKVNVAFGSRFNMFKVA
ncbi:MAG: hypothetical protein GY835_22525 [bacterium]|nr:hypothetical protein [bacterium]